MMKADSKWWLPFGIFTGFLLLGLLWSAVLFRPADPVRVCCKLARLPAPPGKVLHRKYESNGFAGGGAFVFTASKREIKDWLSRCKDIEPKDGIPYTPTHYLVSMTSTRIHALMSKPSGKFHLVSTHSGWDRNEGDWLTEYEVGHIRFPWFTPHITHGVRYNIPNDSHQGRGQIFVDWDTNTVWVTADHN